MCKFWKKYKNLELFWHYWIPVSVIWFFVSLCLASTYGDNIRGLAYLLASPLVIVGLYFASKRTGALESQSKIDSNRLLAETFAKSIELLGHDREAVRQGAIYALGKIADTNPEELIVIANTLCAFVRHECSTNKDEKPNESLAIDIEAAIKTIVKLSSKLERGEGIAKYDLSNIRLVDADFSRANLSFFNLSDSVFKRVSFEQVNFSNANLVGTVFIDTDFNKVEFDELTELSRNGQMTKTDLSSVINLTKEQLETATGKENCISSIELPKNAHPKNWKK